jgi:hypothetical protein
MSLNKKLRLESKIDSRRFGKGIVCKIIYGPLLDFLYQKGVIPSGIFINKTGLDPISRKVAVIPVNKYKQLVNSANQSRLQTPEDNSKISEDELEVVRNISNQEEQITSAIKQSVIIVTISGHIPNNEEAGPDPTVYDIIIDSLDVNQAVEGNYILTTNNSIQRNKTLRE